MTRMTARQRMDSREITEKGQPWNDTYDCWAEKGQQGRFHKAWAVSDRQNIYTHN
jgi:hypothetical protein